MIRLFLFLSLSFVMPSFAQVYKGKVTDKNSIPIQYVNVVFSRSDSTFISGCITGEDGRYTMELNDTVIPQLMTISCIGYHTKVFSLNEGVPVLIVLQDDISTLDEVVIKAQRPVYKMKSGILSAKIEGTLLGSLGTADDVLKQLPFIEGSGDKLEVFGRGTPLIYLNNRLVKNENELSQLKSEQIKDIQIIMNPGSQYSSEVNAIIKITSLCPVGDGFGGSLMLRGRQKRTFVHDEFLDLNYHKDKWDLFGSFFFNDAKWKQDQLSELGFIHDGNLYLANEKGKIGFQNRNMEFIGGINNVSPQNIMWGIKYTYSKSFNTPSYLHFQNNLKENEQTYSLSNQNDESKEGDSHYVNAYFRKEYKNKSSINVDGSFITRNNFSNAIAREERDGIEKIIPSTSKNDSYLYALKAWGNRPLFDGELELGVEGTNTINNQDYKMDNKDLLDNLPNSYTEVRQMAVSSYITYGKSWNNFSMDAGLRYEFINFDYSLNGIRRNEQSKIYHNIFPSLSISYWNDNLSMDLSYRTTIIKPSYYQLRSTVTYNSSYSYEGGNPALQRNINHQIGFLMNYNDFTLDCSYTYMKDYIMFYQGIYKNQAIILSTFTNEDKQVWNVGITYSPSISIWKPSFTLGVSAQNLHFNGISYNTPLLSYSWKNMISLSDDWLFTFNINGECYGNDDLSISKSYFNSDLSVKKNFGKTLDLYLGIQDIFNTYREYWIMNINNHIKLSKWNNRDYRNIYLRMVLKINKASNKYKGGKAGREERNRL